MKLGKIYRKCIYTSATDRQYNIFGTMLSKMPTGCEMITADNCKDLDMYYITTHSGSKEVSSTIDFARQDTEHDIMTDAGLAYWNAKLVDMVWSMHGDNWTKMWSALNEEYAPLENYNMEEERTPDLETKTTLGSTQSTTYGKTETTTPTVKTKSTAKDKTYGFNSSSAVPTGEAETTSEIVSGNTIVGNSGSDSTTGSGSDTVTHKGTEKLTRHGNIGVTTSQQMLESELKLRQWELYLFIMNNLDEVFTCRTFANDCDETATSEVDYQGYINWGRIKGNITKQTDLMGKFADKQNTLIAGTNISIVGDVISATGSGAEYTAGENITIQNNVISAVDTKYTAGEGIAIAGTVISATAAQEYTAGTGIDITNHEISVEHPLPDSTGETGKYLRVGSTGPVWETLTPGTVVSGTSTGNNWTTITIAGTTKNIPTGGSGEPSAYIKSAQVVGDSLVLTNKDDTTVAYTPASISSATIDQICQ